MFIKVVDRSTAGWGHITVDDFQFDAKVLREYPGPVQTKNESNYPMVWTSAFR